MMRALDTRYPISIRNESIGGSGRTSSRFPIRCLRVALMNPRNSTPLPAYDACYTIECGFHCATDCLPPIQITIVRSSSARPRDRVRQRIRHHVRLVIFQIHNSFTFLYSYHYWHWRFSLEFWMNSNWIISRRDWFWKRTFSKMGFTWNNKYEVQI